MFSISFVQHLAIDSTSSSPIFLIYNSCNPIPPVLFAIPFGPKLFLNDGTLRLKNYSTYNMYVLIFFFYIPHLVLRVDLNEGCFLGLFQYFHEISVFVGFFLQENTEISGKIKKKLKNTPR